ncbi:MAG: signal peptidase I [Corynebacterium sp.]|nr:signal peptidase I [Corynebacterium sp.]
MTETTSGRPRKERKEQPWYIEIPLVIILTLVFVFVIQTFIGRVYLIPSASMEPTLHGCSGCTGDRIIVDKITYDFSDPQPGDVVVFKGTDEWNTGFVSNRSDNPVISGLQTVGSLVGLSAPNENDLVKRIIARGGQTVQCLPGDSGVMVDGQLTNDGFVLNPPTYPVDPASGSVACGGPYFGPITVPQGYYFMMGDNRTNSLDSRYHQGDETMGAIPEENIIGKVQAIMFPIGRMGTVRSQPILEAAQ